MGYYPLKYAATFPCTCLLIQPFPCLWFFSPPLVISSFVSQWKSKVYSKPNNKYFSLNSPMCITRECTAMRPTDHTGHRLHSQRVLVPEHTEPTVLIYRRLFKDVTIKILFEDNDLWTPINHSPFPVSKRNTCIFLKE